jgi:type III pantothenate kinase
VLRVVADLGNTRLKWGRLDQAGRLIEDIALPLDDTAAWAAAWAPWDRLGPGSSS